MTVENETDRRKGGKRDKDNTATETGTLGEEAAQCGPGSPVKARACLLHALSSPSTGCGGLRKVFSIAAGNTVRQNLSLVLSQDKKKDVR